MLARDTFVWSKPPIQTFDFKIQVQEIIMRYLYAIIFFRRSVCSKVIAPAYWDARWLHGGRRRSTDDRYQIEILMKWIYHIIRR